MSDSEGESQKSKQIDGKRYSGGAHAQGLKAETTVTGATRIDEDVRVNSSITGQATLTYKKNGSTTTVEMKLKNGSITKVTENKKK